MKRITAVAFGLMVALYVLWIGANVAHARAVVAAGGSAKHECKSMGAVAHHCRHVSADGKVHKDKAHDGKGNISNQWGVMLRQARYAAMLGFFQDEASVPPECTCMVSCFLSGDGLPSPSYPNDDADGA